MARAGLWPQYRTAVMDSSFSSGDGVSSDADSPLSRRSPSPQLQSSRNAHVRRLFNTEELNQMSNSTLQGNSHSVPTCRPIRLPSRPPVDKRMDDILQELKQANSRLTDVTNRLDLVEGRLKGLEEASVCTASTSSEAPAFKKRKVPPQVRVSVHVAFHLCICYQNVIYLQHLVREIYKTHMEQSEEFTGFDLT